MRLSKLANQMKPSSTLATTTKANELRKQGKDVIGFGAGEPDFEVDESIRKAAIEAAKMPGIGKYAATAGLPELITSIRKKLLKENNIDYGQNEILVSPGAKYSLYLTALSLLDPGDEAILPIPYWLSYETQVRLCNATPIFVKTRDFQLDIEEIKSKINKRTKVIYVNSPSNPSGAVYDKQDLIDLANLAVENQIYIISDDIYEKIFYDKKPLSVASLEQEIPGIKELTITINGPSKEFAMPGWRVGYAAGPEKIIKKMSAIQSHTTSNTSTVMQHAAIAALKLNNDFVTKMISEFDKRRKYIVDRLNKIPGIKCVMPDGAFYAFPNISKTGMKSEEFSNKLLEQAHVAVVPGKDFGDDNCVRLSYTTSMENIEKGLNMMEGWLEKI